MSTRTEDHLAHIVLGAITSASLGSIVFQALGTIALGLLGALGGYIFTYVIKPRLDKLRQRLQDKKDNKKAE